MAVPDASDTDLAGLKADLSVDERLSQASDLKTKGNSAFEANDEQLALKYWHYALLYSAGINSFASMYGCKSTEEQNKTAADLTSTIYNNLAACYIRQLKWEKAIYAASKTLAIAPKNLKALYRRAQSYLELDRTEMAAKDIDLALDQHPNDPVIRQLGQQLLEAYERQQDERDQSTNLALQQ